MKGEIRYLERKDIDEKKWTYCIMHATNGLCYSDIDFLDSMATQWSALVLDDYEAVMPLAWRKKFGIMYLYQPAFSQQTGIVSNNAERNIPDEFLAAIPPQFKYWDIQLNSDNIICAYPYTLRNNFLLSLAKPQSSLLGSYHRNALRNIRKARDQRIEVVENISASTVLALHLRRFEKQNRIAKEDYAAFEKLLDRWAAESRAEIIGAQDNRGHIIASSGYIVYKNRITFIINGNSNESLENGATHLLKDHIIRKYAGSDYWLDFEGSDNPDFARFYQQFGVTACERYPRIILNRLPWPLNWFKR